MFVKSSEGINWVFACDCFTAFSFWEKPLLVPTIIKQIIPIRQAFSLWEQGPRDPQLFPCTLSYQCFLQHLWHWVKHAFCTQCRFRLKFSGSHLCKWPFKHLECQKTCFSQRLYQLILALLLDSINRINLQGSQHDVTYRECSKFCSIAAHSTSSIRHFIWITLRLLIWGQHDRQGHQWDCFLRVFSKHWRQQSCT